MAETEIGKRLSIMLFQVSLADLALACQPLFSMTRAAWLPVTCAE